MKRDILVNDDLLDPVTWNHDFRTGPRIPRMQCSGTNGSHWWMMGLSPWWMVTKNDLAVPSSASASGAFGGWKYRWFLRWSLEISSSLAFLWMISKGSVGGKKEKHVKGGLLLWFHVVIQCISMLYDFLCCSTSSTCFDFPQITTSDPEWLIAVRQRRTEESWKILKQKNRRNVSETPRNLNMNTMHWAEGILISTMLHYDSLTSFLTGFPRTSNFRRTEPQASSKERETSRVH